MTWEIASDVLIDALKDSALVFAFVFLFHVVISFFENRITKVMTKKRNISPLFGSLFGLIPQCGTSVLGADLYVKKYITLGALTAIFLSCNDEALIILLTHPSNDTVMVIPLILIKFLVGFLTGIAIDYVFDKQEIKHPNEELHDVICEEHHHKNIKIHKYFLHPLLHSLEIFIYVFIINSILGLIIASVGNQTFVNFMIRNRYLSPLFTSIIGLIPNCASSVLISTLFINHDIGFGALLSGLLVNSGLGIMILLKNKSTVKISIFIIMLCLIIGIFLGYIASLIVGF